LEPSKTLFRSPRLTRFANSLRIPISFIIMMRRCWASASGQNQLELVPRLDVGARDDGGVKSISLKRASISTASGSSGHCIAFLRVYASIIGRSIGGDPDSEGLFTGISARSIAVQQAFWDGHHRRSCNGSRYACFLRAESTSGSCKRFEFGWNGDMMQQIVHFGCALDCIDSLDLIRNHPPIVMSHKCFATSIGAI
jgi:hypothetical protein